MGKLEKLNFELKTKIKNLTQGQNRERPTYADMVNFKEKENQSYIIEAPKTVENKQWITPPPVSKKFETIVRINHITDSKKAIEHLKKQINPKETGSFKAVKHTKDGAIVIESHNTEQQEKLKLAIKDKENINIKEAQNTHPMFMVTGIEKGFTNEEFLDEIERLNYEIVEELGFSVQNKIKIIT